MSPQDHDLAAISQLESLAFQGWPALETRDVSGWRLRFAGGYTKRSNSINALGPDASTDPKLADELEQAYRDRGLRPVWRLTPLAPPAIGERLAGAGYQAIERSHLQTAPLTGAFGADPEVRIEARPSDAWLSTFCAHSPVAPQHQPAMLAMLAAMPSPAGFARVEKAGDVVATAIGVVQGDHMGLFDVLVLPAGRRQGFARRLTESLYAWAYGHGARTAWLQVVATNQAALPLYAAQGFRTRYDYEYRIPALP